MQVDITSLDYQASIARAKLCESIFDSITIYMHITTSESLTTMEDTAHHLSRLSISNVEFTDPSWKDALFHIDADHFSEAAKEEMKSMGEADPSFLVSFSNASYERHKKLMLDLAYILTIRGHEVFICTSRNPSERNGEYTDFSKPLRDTIRNMKDSLEPKACACGKCESCVSAFAHQNRDSW